MTQDQHKTFIESLFIQVLEKIRHTSPESRSVWDFYWGVLNCIKEYHEEERDQ